MKTSNRSSLATLVSSKGVEAEVTVSIEYDYDTRDGRGHTMGHLWAWEWPLDIDVSEVLSLKLKTGQEYRILFTSPTNVHTEMSGHSSIEADFILESHIRSDTANERT